MDVGRLTSSTFVADADKSHKEARIVALQHNCDWGLSLIHLPYSADMHTLYGFNLGFSTLAIPAAVCHLHGLCQACQRCSFDRLSVKFKLSESSCRLYSCLNFQAAVSQAVSHDFPASLPRRVVAWSIQDIFYTVHPSSPSPCKQAIASKNLHGPDCTFTAHIGIKLYSTRLKHVWVIGLLWSGGCLVPCDDRNLE